MNISEKPLSRLSDTLTGLVRGRLWLQVTIGMILGVTAGILMGPSVGWLSTGTANLVGNWLALPGRLFLLLIQMIVIPLVFSSVIHGLAASESYEQLKKMGFGVLIYFVITTIIAVAIGFFVSFLIRPGQYIDSAKLLQSLENTTAIVSNAPHKIPTLSELPQTMLTLLPQNPLNAMVKGEMLQVVLFAIIVGIALLMIPRKQAQPLLDVLGSLQAVCMAVVKWAMWLAPFAVFGLLTQLTSKIGVNALIGMGVYVGTVLLGLFILLLLYLLLVMFLGGVSPLRFLSAVHDVLLLAFSTSSSAAVMPLSIKTVEDQLGVRSSIAQFVIPLGATINMNGTALYQGVATIFLAQVFGIDIGATGLLLIIVTAVGASIGSPATPGVGIVVLALVLDSVGIPTSGIALIIGVDRILDMSRTAINVCGDMVACKLTDCWLTSTSEGTGSL